MATKKRKTRKRTGWGASHRGSSPMVPRQKRGGHRGKVAKHGKTAAEQAVYRKYLAAKRQLIKEYF